jgi:hypothetical protein
MKYFMRKKSFWSETRIISDEKKKPLYSIKFKFFGSGIIVFSPTKEKLSSTIKRFLFPKYQVLIKNQKIGTIKKTSLNPFSFIYKLNLNHQEYILKIMRLGYKLFKNNKEIGLIDTLPREVPSFLEYLRNIHRTEYQIFIDDKEDQLLILTALITIFYHNIPRYYR